MAVSQDNQFWREFISLYKDLPELWQVKNEIYRDRSRKHSAYAKLVAFLKTKDKNADKEIVKKKLNTLRGSYRRERKKVIQSLKSGATEQERYVTTLWYYNDLEFLHDEEIPEEGSSFSENIDEKRTYNKFDAKYRKLSKRKKIRKEIEVPGRPAPTAAPCDKNMSDCADIYGKAWAAQFRQLEPIQQMHAKRAMDEILYQGMLGNLPRTQSAIYNCLVPNHPRLTPVQSPSWQQDQLEISAIEMSSDEKFYEPDTSVKRETG